ncbi:MAG: pyridoxamine 5'-phosphate oxidase [Chlamydiota bacterium]
MDIQQLRTEYRSTPLMLKDMHSNPIEQLKLWMHTAIDEGVVEPNAMVLATASKDGQPSTRTVLIKQIHDEGIVFYTNYKSRKGREVLENPKVSVTIFWKEIDSQITIDGTAEKIPDEESEVYFSSRPRETQIGAWSSNQGEVLASRSVLVDAFENYTSKYVGQDVPKPPHWGGYIIRPTLFIFWKGREHRLHDRFLYEKETAESWNIKRISP